MSTLDSIRPGDVVESRFILSDRKLDFPVFDAPHIGVSAFLDTEGNLQPNPDIEKYWSALGASQDEIWQPGSDMKRGEQIDAFVRASAQLLLADVSGTVGIGYDIFGEILSFGEGLDFKQSEGAYTDTVAHVDFVPAERLCAAAFIANTGGTIAYAGRYSYLGNLVPSYDADARNMYRRVTGPGELLFTSDARTFLHARDPSVEHLGRSLGRLFIGSTHES